MYGRSSKEPRSALSLLLVGATCQSIFTAAPAQGVGLARTCVAVVQRAHSINYVTPIPNSYNCLQSHSSRVRRLKRVSSLSITRKFHAEHTVDHRHEMSTFHRHLECVMPRFACIIHSAPRQKPTSNVCSTAILRHAS